MTVLFNNEHLTEEEATAVENFLAEMRAEKEKEKMIAMYTGIIQYEAWTGGNQNHYARADP